MTVLLTGGAGYIGSHVAVELLQSGYDVIIADTFYNSSPKVPIIISEITGKSVRTYYVDIQNSADLEQIFKQHEINAVMHFAGYKAVGESVQQPLKYYRGNLDSTLTLLETMSKYQVKNLIFSSSATVYGNPATLPITEACPTGDIASPYGWTKYMIEQITKGYVRVKMECKDYILAQKTAIDALRFDPKDSELNMYAILTMGFQGNLSMAQTYYTAAKPYLALEHAEVIKKYLNIK
mgnify:CR=1 FL=1